MKQRITTVISDLDNTLYDWVDMWCRSFGAMLDQLVADGGVPREQLEAEFKAVHQRHGTSEYAFSIEELPSLIQKHPGQDPSRIYEAAIQAYRDVRRATLKLYPTVRETLDALKRTGCLLVAYTESMEYYTRYRMIRLGLDELFDYLYSPEDHALPKGMTPEQVRRYSADRYVLKKTVQKHTPRGELKPNRAVLLDIIRLVGAEISECVYIGDSLMKDVKMAQDASVTDVWAKYGVAQQRPEYELLRRVTHWADNAVEREKVLTAQEVSPTYVLENTFGDLLALFDFATFQGGASRVANEPATT